MLLLLLLLGEIMLLLLEGNTAAAIIQALQLTEPSYALPLGNIVPWLMTAYRT